MTDRREIIVILGVKFINAFGEIVSFISHPESSVLIKEYLLAGNAICLKGGRLDL